jgi:hypothetical protein
MTIELNNLFFEIVYKVLNDEITEFEYIKILNKILSLNFNLSAIDISKKIVFLFLDSNKYLSYSFTLISITKEFVFNTIKNNECKKLLVGEYIRTQNKIDTILNYTDSLNKSIKLLKSTCSLEHKKINYNHHAEAISRIYFLYKKIGIVYLSTLEIQIYDNEYLQHMRQCEIINYLNHIFKKVVHVWKSLIYKCFVYLDLEKRYIETLINKNENIENNDIISFSTFYLNLD